MKSKIIKFLSVSVAAIAISFILSNNTLAISTGDVNARIYGGAGRTGTKWASDHDLDYRSRLQRNVTGWEPVRTAINRASVYGSRYWLSAAGNPTKVTDIVPEADGKTIKLQINRAVVITGSVVQPDYNGSGGTNAIIGNSTDGRWIQPTNARDANPVAPTGSAQSASLTNWHWKVISVKAKSNSAGTFPSSPVGKTISNNRSNSSRYWIATPLQFTYKQESGFKANENVVIEDCSNQTVVWRWTDNENRGKACSDISITVKPRENWTINAQSYIKKQSNNAKSADFSSQGKITAKVGDYLVFKHDMRAVGTDMIKSTNWKINTTGSAQWGNRTALSGTARGKSNELFMRSSWTTLPNLGGGSASYMLYKSENTGGNPGISSLDLGRNICQRVQYSPVTSSNNGTGYSNEVCAYVSYDYEIKPCIKTPQNPCGGKDDPLTPGEPGKPLTPEIDPGGGKTKPTDWIVSTWKVPSDKESAATPTNPQDNTNGNPCNTYNGSYGITQAQSGCSEYNPPNGHGKDVFTGTTTLNKAIVNFTMPENAELGERYCFALSVSPFKMSAGESEATQNGKRDWRHSAPYCFIAAKKPKMQVWGGNVYSGTNIQTNKTKFSTGTFGSWVEYAGISKGTINSFTSGANNNNNKLTMANKSGIYGKYGDIPADNLASKIKARYSSPAATSASMTCSNVADGKVCKQKETTAEVKVPAQMNSSEASRTVILDASNQNVYIDRDISANTTLGKASDAQAFIIIGKNIYIHPDVTNIDAWLLASDSVVTCANPGKSGTARKDKAFVNESNCGKPLRVNGPVQTKNLNSWRTNGSMLNTAADPAEVYNLRADTYLWAASKGSGDGRFITTYTRELSPRF